MLGFSVKRNPKVNELTLENEANVYQFLSPITLLIYPPRETIRFPVPYSYSFERFANIFQQSVDADVATADGTCSSVQTTEKFKRFDMMSVIFVHAARQRVNSIPMMRLALHGIKSLIRNVTRTESNQTFSEFQFFHVTRGVIETRIRQR